MKKIINYSLFIMIVTLLLVGCSKDNKLSTEWVTDTDIKTYVEISKDLTKNIHSNSSFSELENTISRYRDVMSDKVFSENFDTSQLHIMNMYDFDYLINKYEQKEIVVEKYAPQQVVSVFIISELSVGNDMVGDVEEDYLSDNNETFISYPVDIYRFKDGKLVEYVKYW